MIAVLTAAAVFIAVVLAVVYWKTVRELLLWSAAAINVLSMVLGLLAALGAVVVFTWAAIVQNADLVPLGVTLVLVFLALMVVSGVLWKIENNDRDKQFARFRAWAQAQYERQFADKSSDNDTQ